MIAHDSTADLSGALRLPALSPAMASLQRLLVSRACGIREVTAALDLDPRLSAYVLHVAHAQRARGDPAVKSIPQAVCVLGLSALGMIAIRGAAMLAFEDARACPTFDVDEFWRHSILAAHVGHELAGRMNVRVCGLSADQLYACVLLHDVGQLVLLQNLGPAYAELRKRLQPGIDGTRIEDGRLGRNHAEVGAQVAASWGLPEPIPERIAHHHVPDCANGSAELARILTSADRIAHEIAAHGCPSAEDLVRNLVDPPQSVTHAGLVDVVSAAAKWYPRIGELLLGPQST